MKIGIYRTKFPVYSESFITEQGAALGEDVIYICRDKMCDESSYAIHTVADGFFYRLLFVLFGFVKKSRLEALKNVDVIHAHFGQDGYYAMKLSKALGVQYVVTFHGQDCCVRDWEKIKSFQISNILYLLNRKKIFASAKKIIAVSEYIKRKLVAQGCPEKKIAVHYIGVDCDKFFRSKASFGESKGKMRVLCVGRHVAKKGIGDLISAAYLCKESIEIVQIGDGPNMALNKKLAHDLGVADKVLFLGAVPHDEISKYFNEADVFCLPSTEASNGDAEALGIVFLEAQAMKLPVLATLHGGIPEAVKNNVSGYLVDEGQPLALAEKLDYLAKNLDVRLSMGLAGRENVEKNFDIKAQSIKLKGIYCE